MFFGVTVAADIVENPLDLFGPVFFLRLEILMGEQFRLFLGFRLRLGLGFRFWGRD